MKVTAYNGVEMKVDISDSACLQHDFGSGDKIEMPDNGGYVTVLGVAPGLPGTDFAGMPMLWFKKKDGRAYCHAPGGLRQYGFVFGHSKRPTSELGVLDLIDRFEKDIVYDCHSYTARFERSQAMKELHRRGKAVLRPIIEHLKRYPPTGFMSLDCAWGHLLNWIEVNVDSEKTGPKDRRDTAGWIAWAEKFAA